MRRALVAAAGFLLFLLLLAGCDQHKGDPCSNPGDVWSGHGVSLTCGKNGTWQRI